MAIVDDLRIVQKLFEERQHLPLHHSAFFFNGTKDAGYIIATALVAPMTVWHWTGESEHRLDGYEYGESIFYGSGDKSHLPIFDQVARRAFDVLQAHKIKPWKPIPPIFRDTRWQLSHWWAVAVHNIISTGARAAFQHEPQSLLNVGSTAPKWQVVPCGMRGIEVGGNEKLCEEIEQVRRKVKFFVLPRNANMFCASVIACDVLIENPQLFSNQSAASAYSGAKIEAAYQRAELALKLEPLIAAKAKENLKTAEPGKRGGTPLQNSAKGIDTRAELAKSAGVSHDTIHKARVIALKAPEPVKEKLRKGEVSINSAYTDIRRAENEERRELRREKNRQLVGGTNWWTITKAAEVYSKQAELPLNTAKTRLTRACNANQIEHVGKGMDRRLKPEAVSHFIVHQQDPAVEPL